MQLSKYRVVEETSRYKLAQSVEALMEIGWLPQGGVVVHKGAMHDWYIQAMVK